MAYDNLIIQGNLYRQAINDCYKNNLFISNKMKAVGDIIDLKKIATSLIAIVGENDDLVSLESTLAITDYITSRDKEYVTSPGGHIGLYISTKTPEKLRQK